MSSLGQQAMNQSIDQAMVVETFQRNVQDFIRHQMDDLWTAEEIAIYMKLSKKSVQNRIITHDTFPSPVLLPPCNSKRWVAKEVRAWALKHR